MNLELWQKGNGQTGSQAGITVPPSVQAQPLSTEGKSTLSWMNNFLQRITDGVATYDCEWRITFVNQRAAQLVGKTPDQLIGKYLWEMCPEQIGDKCYTEYQRSITEQVLIHFQEFHAPLNIWFEVHAYPSQEGLVTLFQNISESNQSEASLQKAYKELEKRVLERTLKLSHTSTLLEFENAMRQQAEDALQATNQQLASICESITDGFCAVDHQWQFTYINRKAEQILQKNQTELLGKNMWEVYPQSVGSKFYHQCYEAARTGTPVQFEDFSPVLNCWIENNIYPSPEGISIYFQDITQRKQIEQERNQLRREQAARASAELAERRCGFLAEASKVLASSLDYETTLLSVARLVVPFLADYCLIHKLDEDGQLRLVAAIHCDQQKQELLDQLSNLYGTYIQNPKNLTAQVLRTGKPLLIPETSAPSGQFMVEDAELMEIHRQLNPNSLMVIPLAARGLTFGTVVLATAESNRHYGDSELSLAVDLSCRAAMAIDNAQLYSKAQESNRLKDEFLMTLSHELRTPLNAILGWARMLLTRKLDEKTVHRALETIERKARAQVEMIYDLLDISRLLTGKLCLNPGWVELSLIIHNVIDSLHLAAEAKSIQLISNLDSSVSPVRGDPERLQQVIWNLLSNAIKFTPNGGQVEIQLTSEDDNAVVRVSDTGQGIQTDFLPYVFDRFRQADGTMTRRHGGLGLGLALVRQLVELHGGTIEAFSQGEGTGATFTVKLPIAPTEMNSFDRN